MGRPGRKLLTCITLKFVRRELSIKRAAEGACCTHNGQLNAQAKGLTTAAECTAFNGVPYWREVASDLTDRSPPKEQTRIAG